MKKLDLSVGILSWKSDDVLDNTLKTYINNGLLDMVNDVTILFQEFSKKDYDIAVKYGLNLIGLNKNIGIGNGFKKLVINTNTNNILLLEHDWNLIENQLITYKRIEEGLNLLNNGFQCIRYRHQKKFGEPLFSKKYIGKELTEYDKIADNYGTHLLDSIYWCNPSIIFPEQIKFENGWFTTTSRWANFTNNPCLYKKEFYLSIIEPFMGIGIDLEYNISNWWSRQNFKVAQGNGLFKHNDFIKYGILKNNNLLI
jgi:hypothetical protein